MKVLVFLAFGLGISYFLFGRNLNRLTQDPRVNQAASLAAVFRWKDGVRQFQGTIQPASVPDDAPTPDDRSPVSVLTSNGDYEIWIAAPGTTRGYWLSDSLAYFAPIDGFRRCGTKNRAPSWLSDMVKRAEPLRTLPRQTVSSNSRAFSGSPGPFLLEILAGSSHVIVAGSVVGMVRMNHTPVNSSNEQQHTVYAVAVEDYLKSDRWGKPAVIKVHQEGGSLPWRSPRSGAVGRGYMPPGNPSLQVGSRYLLFLVWMGDGKGWPPFLSSTIEGVEGKVADMDEYEIIHPLKGRLLLAGGMSRSPVNSGNPEVDNWRFLTGPQILDIPEAHAIKAIRDEVQR